MDHGGPWWKHFVTFSHRVTALCPGSLLTTGGPVTTLRDLRKLGRSWGLGHSAKLEIHGTDLCCAPLPPRKEIDLGFRFLVFPANLSQWPTWKKRGDSGVFQVLVPGVLFTPCLLSPLNNFLRLDDKSVKRCQKVKELVKLCEVVFKSELSLRIPYFRESALLVLFGTGRAMLCFCSVSAVSM